MNGKTSMEGKKGKARRAGRSGAYVRWKPSGESVQILILKSNQIENRMDDLSDDILCAKCCGEFTVQGLIKKIFRAPKGEENLETRISGVLPAAEEALFKIDVKTALEMANKEYEQRTPNRKFFPVGDLGFINSVLQRAHIRYLAVIDAELHGKSDVTSGILSEVLAKASYVYDEILADEGIDVIRLVGMQLWTAHMHHQRMLKGGGGTGVNVKDVLHRYVDFLQNSEKTVKIGLLLKIASASIEVLNKCCESDPDSIRGLAGTISFWPVLMNFDRKAYLDGLQLMKNVGLSDRLGNVYMLARAGIIKSEQKRQAFNLIKGLQYLRTKLMPGVLSWKREGNVLNEAVLELDGRVPDELSDFPYQSFVLTEKLVGWIWNLPEFSNKNGAWKLWWRAGKELLMLMTDGSPEKCAHLKYLWRSARSQDHELTEAAIDSSIRNDISKGLLGEFETLSNSLDKVRGSKVVRQRRKRAKRPK